MATSEEVAKLAGVSRATVSRVLNGSARTSDAVRSRVHAAMKALGYEPDVVAQSLVRQRSRALALGLFEGSGTGLPIAHFGHTGTYFYLDMLKIIERETAELGYDLLMPSRPLGNSPENYVRSLQMRRVAGTIMLALDQSDPRIQALLQANIPTVFIDALGQGSRAIYVKSDHSDGARQATEHLLALGHTRIVFMTGPTGDLPAMERLLGGQQALAKAGIVPATGLICHSGWNTEEAYRAAIDLLARCRDFSAIVTGSDMMAMGVLRALYEAGLRVPQDVSVTGFDDITLCEYTIPPLTTVRQDRVAMVRGALQRLIAMIEEEGIADPIIVPTQLVVRDSTGPVQRPAIFT